MATRKKAESLPEAEKSRSKEMRLAEVGGTERPNETEAQIKALEEGLRLFRSQRFAEAKKLFEIVSRGPQSAVANTARTHISVCERRMRKPVLELESADDHYNYGVERLNARDLEAARKHLEIALALRPNADYMLYGLAAALALSGDTSGAYENLRRAIEVDARNRNSARQDPDFASVVHHPLFSQLFYPERPRPF